MKNLLGAALVAAVLPLCTTVATAQEKLIFATTHPAQMTLDADFLTPWANAINADGKGIVEIDVRHGPAIANPKNFYERTIDNVIQIGFGLQVFGGNRWPRSLVATQPFLIKNAEHGSVALWDVYADGAFDAEMDDIVVLMFGQFPQSGIHTNKKPITSIKDVKGLKMITSTPANVAVMKAQGAAPLSFNVTEQYEALQRGSADGTVMNYTGLPAFHLDEVTTEHFNIPMGGPAGMVFMAKDKWNSLSQEARDVIMKHSGADGTRAFGQFIDGWEASAKAYISGLEGHTVHTASDKELAEMTIFAEEKLHTGWAAHAPDGEKVLGMFKAALDKETAFQAEKAKMAAE